MHACECAPEHRPRIRLIELRWASPHPGKDGKAVRVEPKQRATLDLKRSGDRQLGRGHLGGERMLLADLLIAPAPRTVELEDQQTLVRAELIHAVFVAVEREQPPVTLEANRGSGIQNHIRA
jgi:hypothetical protein